MRPFLRLLAVLLLALSTAGAVRAEEYIQSYHAEIGVATDGTLTVTESIRVRAEGRAIRRGIFRDLPLTRGDGAAVDIRVLAVERDGRPEDWFTERITGGLRLYTGNEDRLLPPGSHLYRITYETDRQILRLAGRDEIYWNVTGNGWRFRIAETSARVVLPAGAAPLETAVFTGPSGATGRDARISVKGDAVRFVATRPFAPGEGMTVGVALPKGVIALPSAGQERLWWLRDHLDVITATTTLFAVLAYYFRAWAAVGRDPPEGVVVPRWDAPEGISPALVNYIDNRGFSGQGWTALAAAALDLAVKGHIVLEDLKRSIVMRRAEPPPAATPLAGEAALLAAIDAAGGRLVVDKANGERVETLGTAFRAAIEKEHGGRYYRANRLYIAGGVALSLAALAGLLAFGALEEEGAALIVVSVAVSMILGIVAVKIGRRLGHGGSLLGRLAAIVGLGFMGLVAAAILAGLVSVALAGHAHPRALLTLAAGGGVGLVNALFFFLMGAPTPLGRRLSDGIEGLRLYLTLAEKDRMNMAGAPQMSPAHFETLLPYAVALGVEKPWTETFETWLASASAAAAAYQPVWYGGGDGEDFAGRIGGFSSSMSSTIASTIAQPSSSSDSGFSGDGGFSGGGGGGGGGGGW